MDWKKLKKEDLALITKICERIRDKEGILTGQDSMSTAMDITAAHLDCNLDLNKLLNADSFNFTHDVVGIINNINRKTGKLENCFLPRCAIN